MRPVTITFLAAEALDVLTTFVGLRLGFVELNPIYWPQLVTLKVFAVVMVVAVLQVMPRRKIYWIVPAVAGLIVVWNVLNIVLYYI